MLLKAIWKMLQGLTRRTDIDGQDTCPFHLHSNESCHHDSFDTVKKMTDQLDDDRRRRMADDDVRRLQDWQRQVSQFENDDRHRRIAENDLHRSQDDWHRQSSTHWDHSSSSSSWNNN